MGDSNGWAPRLCGLYFECCSLGWRMRNIRASASKLRLEPPHLSHFLLSSVWFYFISFHFIFSHSFSIRFCFSIFYLPWEIAFNNDAKCCWGDILMVAWALCVRQIAPSVGDKFYRHNPLSHLSHCTERECVCFIWCLWSHYYFLIYFNIRPFYYQ